MERSKLIVWTFMFFRFTSSEFVEFYFHGDSRFENTLPVLDTLWTTSGLDLSQCVQACVLTSGCISVSFGQTCYAYSNRAHKTTTPTNVQPGVVYFESKGIHGNLAENKPASQQVTFNSPIMGTYTADKAVDGVRDPRPLLPYDSCALVNTGVATWWKVDLLQAYTVTSVAILARNSLPEQSANLGIGIGLLSSGPFSTCLSTTGSVGWVDSFATFTCSLPLYGEFVRITKNVAFQFMCLCEVEVYGI